MNFNFSITAHDALDLLGLVDKGADSQTDENNTQDVIILDQPRTNDELKKSKENEDIRWVISFKSDNSL